jgi:hypothetical protein
MKDNDPAVADLYARVFDALNEDDGTPEFHIRRADFAFHMTDWLRDLADLSRFASNPAAVNPDEEGGKIYALLSHIVPHLKAAFRALEGHECPDPFLETEPQPAEASA